MRKVEVTMMLIAKPSLIRPYIDLELKYCSYMVLPGFKS